MLNESRAGIDPSVLRCARRRRVIDSSKAALQMSLLSTLIGCGQTVAESSKAPQTPGGTPTQSVASEFVVPAGFHAETYAANVDNARSMALRYREYGFRRIALGWKSPRRHR
jgi:hypothetical protein